MSSETNNTNTIVDQAYLEKVLYLSPTFIAKHSRAMGCFARKPRRFFLAQVMAHLEDLAATAQARAGRRIAYQEANKQAVKRLAEETIRRKKSISGAVRIDFDSYYRDIFGAA